MHPPPCFSASSSRRSAVLTACVLAGACLGGCRYYEVTRADGTTELISRSEYEEMQRTAKRLGNVPTAGNSRFEARTREAGGE